MLESGKLVHKIGFDIDSKSWRNLKNFQNRISMLKEQMKGLNGAVDFKVNASGFRQQAIKVAKIKAEVESKIPSVKPDVMAKREQRITNLRNRLDYQMKKGGVGIQSSTAFMNGGFAKAAEGFRKTGDISAFSQQVSLASRKMIDSAKSAKTMGRSIHDMRSSIVAATAAYTAFSALQNTAMVGMNLESMQAGMKIFAGSDSAVAGEMNYIIGVSERLGLSLMDAAEQYNKFSIVSKDKLTSSQRKDLFEGFSEYATVLQTTPERYQRGMMALQQMMSKGKLSSEELRLQLAENIPGSVQIFAKALNMSEAEMFKQMEMGKILSADIMPAVAKEFARSAREGGALEAATKKTRAELNRFKNALIEVQNAIFTGGMGEGLAGFFKLTSALLKDIKPLATYIGKVLKWAFLGFAQALNIVAAPLRLASNLFSLLDENAKEFVAGGSILAAAGAWIYLSKAIRGVTIAQLGLIKSSRLLASIPWIAAALVAEDVTATVMTKGKANSVTKDLVEDVYGTGNITKGLSSILKPRGGTNFALDSLVAGAEKMFSSSQQSKVEVKIDATGLNDKQIDYRVNQQMGNAITDIAGESGN